MTPPIAGPDPPSFSRRQMLGTVANGFGLLGLAGLLAEARPASRSGRAPPRTRSPSGRRTTPPKAKRVIFLFMNGGPSHVDLFDPKPRLTADHGKPLPFEKPKLARTTTENLMASPFRFARHGQSGIEVSELLPNLASCVDDLCVIRSMVADNINHPNACLQMYTGEQVFSRPSLGSWLLYGLGSENQDLPGFVVDLPERRRRGPVGLELPAGGLPGDARRRPGAPDRQPGQRPTGRATEQRRQLDLVEQLNQQHRREPRGRQPARRADRVVRAGLPDADAGPRGLRHRRRARVRPAALRPRSSRTPRPSASSA